MSYHIDPTATPKTIDLFFQHLNEGRRLAALGIYKIEGDRLEIRVARYQPMFEESTQRPKSFSIEPGSDDTLFVLERYRPLEDEKVIRSGYWVLASEIDDGKSVSEENIRGTHYHFGDGVVSIAKGTMVLGGYVLDTTKQPKQVTMFMRDDKKGAVLREEWHGIYSLESNRLTIAYRRGGPAPEKFESTPGSAVTLLVLERLKPLASPKPDESKAEESQTPPGPATTPTATIGTPKN